ncbi:MAG: GAF domain-containing protein [Betaproteobacteria bacterium]|nr:GAF domain-containing protein [Betaproteobacteria bacterium]MBK9674112.1 GAF domain-containing protein [Betaproteobacteria bacterium]
MSAAGVARVRVSPRHVLPVAPALERCASPDVARMLEPMLDAVVRLAGASAGSAAVVDGGGEAWQPVAAVGVAGRRPLQSAVLSWCETCAEGQDPQSDCVRRGVAGGAERFPVDRPGSVCRHVTALPLTSRGRQVGMLHLMFAEATELPAAMSPLLQAIGDLLGVTLENARLARENLRISLMSERQLMANEVHDSLAQGLTFMRMRMSLLRDAVRHKDDLRAFKYWADVDDALGNSHRRLRELITYFRSQMDPQGLVHALQATAETFFDRTGVAMEFVNRTADCCVAPEREVEVFHIVQEALANVGRHAEAKNVRVTLDRHGENFEVVVEDDGGGFADAGGVEAADAAGHFGLSIMRERARRLGGELAIDSAPGAGTRVRLHFPAVDFQDGGRE